MEEEEILLFKKFGKEKEYHFNIDGIFNKNENISSVIMILSLFFNYDIDLVKFLKDEYFTETEKQIYILLLENFEKKLSDIDYISYSELIKALNTFFKKNIDLFDNSIDIEYLSQKERNLKLGKNQKALSLLKEMERKFLKIDFKYFINFLEKLNKEIEKINFENQNKIIKDDIINEINKSLNNYYDQNNKKFFDGLKNKIFNIRDEKDSINILKNWKEKISIIGDINRHSKSDIKWPKITFSPDNSFHHEDFLKHQLFIDILIKYSEIKNIINKLQNSNNNNNLGLLIQLSEYDEMRNISSFIMNKMDEKCEISSQNKRRLNSVLNSSIIKKLGNFCYDKQNNIISFKIIEEMFKYFNDLSKRKNQKDEIDYFIQNYSFKYKSNFKIIFPKFTCMDFVFLFIDINNESKPTNGYLIKNINIDDDGLDRLNAIDIASKEKNGFIICLNDIIRIIFEKLGYNNDDYVEKLQFIKNINKNIKNSIKDNKINNKNENNEKDINIIKLCEIIINLYNDEELNILNKNFEFDFEDIDFLDFLNNYLYLDKQIIYNRYPSLIYFLVENHFIDKNIFSLDYEDNTSIKSDENKNSMPFWLLCLRYYSSLECIISKEKNYFSQMIDINIKKYLSNELNKRANRKIGINWLSLVCHNKKLKFFELFYEKNKLFLYK